jgi:hypothetical protein
METSTRVEGRGRDAARDIMIDCIVCLALYAILRSEEQEGLVNIEADLPRRGEVRIEDVMHWGCYTIQDKTYVLCDFVHDGRRWRLLRTEGHDVNPGWQDA